MAHLGLLISAASGRFTKRMTRPRSASLSQTCHDAHTYTYVCMYIYICVYIRVYICIYECIYIYVCNLCIYIYTSVYVYVCKVCICIYMMHTYIYILMDIHVCNAATEGKLRLKAS